MASLPPSRPLDSPAAEDGPRPGRLERVALGFTAWAERWIPDPYVFALLATFAVILAALASGEAGLGQIVGLWGDGFWELLPFTLQMCLVIITGYVLAVSGPVHSLIARLSAVPRSPRGAVALVALFAMLSSWFNWGFGLIFSAMLARETARRVPRLDYRAAAASAFLGLGSVWAQGLSGSAALQMATPGAMPPGLAEVVSSGGKVASGVISLSHTIFLWQSLASVAVEILLVTLVMYLSTPTGERARTAEELGVDLGPPPEQRGEPERRGTPGEWLEHAPLLSALFVLLSGAYLARSFWTSGKGLAGLSLNTVNLLFLTLGVALHRTPARLMRAVREATPGVWAVILQFPLYAGIASVVTHTHLNERIAHGFVAVSTRATFPALIALYSAALGVFVPSGGSKWVIEAPYVMRAAHALGVHLGWVVSAYDLGEALANLVQPFWMLPILNLLGLRARDVMGYTGLIFLVLLPVVLVMVTALGLTLSYPL